MRTEPLEDLLIIVLVITTFSLAICHLGII